MADRIYCLRRDTLGDCTDVEAESFARYLAAQIGHAICWSEQSGCRCDEYRAHHDDAQRAWENGAWL